MSLLSPATADAPRTSADYQPPDLISALQENADLWKRVRNLQERDHRMCAEIVDLRRQLNNLRMTRHATSPASAMTFVWPPANSSGSSPAANPEYAGESTELRRENEELRHTITRLRAEASDAADMRDRIRALQKEIDYMRDREHGYLPSPLRERDIPPLRDPLRETLREPLRDREHERERDRDELGRWRSPPSSHSRSSSRELHHPYARPRAKNAVAAAPPPSGHDAYHERMLQHEWERHSSPGIVGSRMRPII